MPQGIFAFLAVVATSFAAAFISSMSGGGSALITIPVYLWLGIPFPVATAIHNGSSCFWVIPASRNYLHGKKPNWKFLFIYTAIGFIGAVLGALFVSQIHTNAFKPYVGILILLLVLWMGLRKDIGVVEKTHISKTKKILMYISAPFLGFYESFFGSGNGIIFSSLAIKLRGDDIIESLGSYYFAAFFWLVISVVIFIWKGQFDLILMIAATIGGLIGGYSGSKLGRYKGNRFVKYAFIIIGTVLGFKLLLGF